MTTYRQNILHGLPIILNPDKERSYSWKENHEIKNGQSWKERIRLDIEDARRETNNWTEFKELMESNGYGIREGAYITYTTPDKKYKIRAPKLGQAYTKEKLELYWKLRDQIGQELDQADKKNLVKMQTSVISPLLTTQS